MFRKLLFKIAKGPLMGQIVGSAFQHCSWAIPVKKVYSSTEIIAFRHPQPCYNNHLIISPKRAVKNLQQMASDDFARYFVKIWEAAQDISAMRPEYHDAFTLVANGGRRQEVQQVHFHMFTDHEMVSEYAAQGQAERVCYRDGAICVLAHPAPDWEIHYVVRPGSASFTAGSAEDQQAYFKGVLQSIDLLNARFNIIQRGYSLVYQRNKRSSDREYPVFHIVSGKKQR
ncbi:MAG: HIT domain-containing protein [Christensenellaceae bacterium]|nr:HIT domain-containing protein [Christensenellaceae bacterium]